MNLNDKNNELNNIIKNLSEKIKKTKEPELNEIIKKIEKEENEKYLNNNIGFIW